MPTLTHSFLPSLDWRESVGNKQKSAKMRRQDKCDVKLIIFMFFNEFSPFWTTLKHFFPSPTLLLSIHSHEKKQGRIFVHVENFNFLSHNMQNIIFPDATQGWQRTRKLRDTRDASRLEKYIVEVSFSFYIFAVLIQPYLHEHPINY